MCVSMREYMVVGMVLTVKVRAMSVYSNIFSRLGVRVRVGFGIRIRVMIHLSYQVVVSAGIVQAVAPWRVGQN